MEKADSAFDRLVFRNPAPRAGSRIGDAAADQIDIGLDPRALDPEDRRQRQRRIHRERVARAVADIADDIEYPPAFVTQDCVIDDVGDEIGRASCRERGCQYVEISVDAGYLQKKTEINTVSKQIHRRSKP